MPQERTNNRQSGDLNLAEYYKRRLEVSKLLLERFIDSISDGDERKLTSTIEMAVDFLLEFGYQDVTQQETVPLPRIDLIKQHMQSMKQML